MLTLPKSLIRPRTFSIKPGLTAFLAGLGRLDVVEGPATLRYVITIKIILHILIL